MLTVTYKWVQQCDLTTFQVLTPDHPFFPNIGWVEQRYEFDDAGTVTLGEGFVPNVIRWDQFDDTLALPVCSTVEEAKKAVEQFIATHSV
jgi:hypothetical protein